MKNNLKSLHPDNSSPGGRTLLSAQTSDFCLDRADKSVRPPSYRHCIVSILGLALLLLASCSLETPEAPPNDNPWDPENPAAPRAPINLTGQVLSETSVSLRWEDRSGNETGFIIEQGEGDLPQDSLWTLVDTVAAQVVSLILEDRHPATEYRYRVLAFNTAGRSTPPESVLILNTTNVAPTRPDSLRATHRNGISVKLDWKDCSANEEWFVVESRTSDTNTYREVDSTAADVTECVIDSLAFDKNYYFRVKAVNRYGVSTSNLDVDYQPGWAPLSAPYDVRALALSENDVNVSWSDSNMTAEEFMITISQNDTLSFNWAGTYGKEIKTWRATQLRANSTYYFKVQARNRLIYSPVSGMATASTAETAPWPPTNLVGSIENELDVRLTWNDNSNIETGFELSESPNDVQHFITIDTLPASVTSTLLQNRAPFEALNYRIRSLGEHGASAWINAATVTPGCFAPQPPANLEAVALTPNDIRLNWTDNSRIEERFEISERISAGSWTVQPTSPANIEELVLSNRTPNTTYSYRIRSSNQYGSSVWVLSAQVTTPGPPPAPTEFSAEGITTTDISMSWTALAGLQDGFILEDSLDESDGFVFLDTLESWERSYTYRNARQHVYHVFKLRAFNEYGLSNHNGAGAMPYAKVAFVACNDAGIVAVDVTDPANPTEIKRLDTPGLAQRIVIPGNEAYVADSYGGVEVFSIFSPALMTQISSFQTDGRAYGIYVSAEKTYVATGDSGLAILHLGNWEHPSQVGRLRTRPGVARSLTIGSNNFAYIAAQDRGVLRVDVSNAASPVIRHESASPSSSQGICWDSRGWVVVAEYSAGLRVLDPDDLHEVGTIPINGNSFDVVQGAYPDLAYFYVANFNRGVTVVRMTPPSSYSDLTTLAMPDDTWGVSVLGDSLLFACVDNAGLKIIDISDPSHPSVLGTFQTPGPARGVAVREYR